MSGQSQNNSTKDAMLIKIKRVIIYITRLFQCEDWFQYDLQTLHSAYSIGHVSLNSISFHHYCFTQS